MRVAFLTNKTARVSLPVLQKLADSRQLKLVHTYFYDTLSESRHSPRQILAQYGAKRVLAKLLQTLAGRFRLTVGKRLGAKRFRPRSSYELATIADLPRSTISNINADESIRHLKDLQVDAVVVCVCKNILRQRVLSLPGVRFINIHPSLLPQYRGPTPTFWMLYHGERETGVTFHEMTPEIDQGPILSQLSLPLDHRRSETEIEFEVFQRAASVVEQVVLQKPSARTPPAATVPVPLPSYHSFPTPTQRRELKQRQAQGS